VRTLSPVVPTSRPVHPTRVLTTRSAHACPHRSCLPAVAEHSAYHHGETSLAGTIVGMAQTYVGSNNIALLHPAGQFGTRLLGGKDAASPRYIFTKLPSLTRLIFHPDDDGLLEYLEDDGQSIEPKVREHALKEWKEADRPVA
jgi:DNA gyrase/topoisomerase IV subunit A